MRPTCFNKYKETLQPRRLANKPPSHQATNPVVKKGSAGSRSVYNNNNIVKVDKVVKVVKAIKAVKVVKKEHSVEMPDTEIPRWQAFDAG